MQRLNSDVIGSTAAKVDICKTHLAVVDRPKNRENEKWADDVDGNLCKRC